MDRKVTLGVAAVGMCLLLYVLSAQPEAGKRGNTNQQNINDKNTYTQLKKDTKSADIYFHNGKISENDRVANMGHKGVTLWFVGLSGSGKSTVAVALEEKLVADGKHVYRLDGDNVRYGLNSDLAFSAEDRTENVRRVGEVARLFNDAGMITIASLISPFEADRAKVRKIHEDQGNVFMEVYVRASLETLKKRDPKGLYAKAERGEIKGFTGLDAPFDEPEHPEVLLDTEMCEVAECVEQMYQALQKAGVF